MTRIRSSRPLSRREAEAARLAAERTKADVIAIIQNAMDIYKATGVSSGSATCEVLLGLVDSHVTCHSVVTEL